MELNLYKKVNSVKLFETNNYLLALMLLMLPGLLRAQAPNISYSGAQTYKVGNAISPLSPTNTGGAVPATVYGQLNSLAGGALLVPINGAATSSSFANPVAVARDQSGNVYVVANYENVIRKISPSGQVTTFAGSGKVGSDNGIGTAATFNYPQGLATDAAGNLYVSDSGNNLIRKITSDGVVTTLAGSGYYGNNNGTSNTASFGWIGGLATDASGNVYVADQTNFLIRKIDPTGAVSTLAGSGAFGYADGTGTAAKFAYPSGVATDAAGNVYVADQDNQRVRKITPSGVVTTLAGSNSFGYNDGTGTSASFGSPSDVATDAVGNVYVMDQYYCMVRKISPTGDVTTLAGSGSKGFANGFSALASFNYPNGIAVDASGNVYVADLYNNLIRKVDLNDYVTTFAGSGGFGQVDGTGSAAYFSGSASGITDAAGNIYIADSNDHLIRKITPAGVVTTLAGSGAQGYVNGTGTSASFYYPTSLALDAANNIYVADQGNNVIRKISPTGVVTTFAGSGAYGSVNGKGTAASFANPRAIAINSTGNIYVADGFTQIRKIDPAGVVTSFVGSSNSGSADGTGAAASFYGPAGLAIDANGNIYVADQFNEIIRKITPGGVVTTIAGNGSFASVDGVGTAASFASPQGIAVDGSGYIYVADSESNLVRKIDSKNVVTTFLNFNTANSYLSSVTVDASGNLYPITSKIVYKVPITGYSINPSLPAGLSFDATTGIISGTPTAFLSSTNYTVAAFNTSGSSSTTLNLTVNAPLAPVLTYNSPQSLAINTAVKTINPTNTGGAVPATIYGQVSTFAGSGSIGFSNGLGTSASFYNPSGVVTDSFGNVYVADTKNNLIRKITPSGLVSTIAQYTSNFYTPTGVATDAMGNVYVAESKNQTIRKIDPNGTITLLAGSSGNIGSVNGYGAGVSFNNPYGVTTDATGNIYVADAGNQLIRKITPSGVVSTFAGTGANGNTNGNSSSASFSNPTDVTTDAAGNFYIADEFNNLIRKITSSGVVSTFAGSGTKGGSDGAGTSASFNNPSGVNTDVAGNVYVADNSNHTIRKITPSGVVTTLAGNGTKGAADGIGIAASFNNPSKVATDAGGNLYVADYSNNIIRKLSLTGYTITPALPKGLSFDATTGAISGTPTVISPATNYTVTAYNVTGSSSATFSLSTFNLSNKNYHLSITGETCNGSSNGLVAVKVDTSLKYSATLSGNRVNTSLNFTDSVKFSNLPAGTYNLTFTIDGQANYSNAYTVTITQPQPLSVFATVNDAAGNIELNLSGGSVYHIQVNNKTYTTTESSFTVPLEQGNNALQVTTDRECQGIFTKLINPSLITAPYPMPFEGTLNLNLGSSNIATVSVRIYSANTGLQVFTADYQNKSGVLQLDLSKLAKGAYGLQLIVNNTKKEFKIIK